MLNLCPEAEFMNVHTISLRFSDLRFPFQMFTLQTSFNHKRNWSKITNDETSVFLEIYVKH